MASIVQMRVHDMNQNPNFLTWFLSFLVLDCLGSLCVSLPFISMLAYLATITIKFVSKNSHRTFLVEPVLSYEISLISLQ